MAMDRANRRFFVGCRSKVMAVMDADTGKVIATLPIGDHVDATAYDPDSKLIFNSNGEGTITVIRQDNPDKYSVVETVETLPRAKTMALDPKTHQLYLSTAENGQFEVLVVVGESGLNSERNLALCFHNLLLPQHCAAPVLMAAAGAGKSSSGSRCISKPRCPFRFVAYGDTRFHDPNDTEAANPAARLALVQAIAVVDPAFISSR